MCSLLCILKSILFGYIIGILISIPLGPSAIESINRTISRGFKEGFLVSLGAISADISYLIIVNCGLLSLLKLNKNAESFFWILSGIAMILIGINSTREKKYCDASKKSYSFFAGYVITFLNPMTPALWIAISTTVINNWYDEGFFICSLSIISMIIGMISWFVLLNVLALKGLKLAKPTKSKKITTVIKYSILVLGVCFLIFGIYKVIGA
ncbi:LysE family translocator [Clostridium massiliodielmoense]|uniref:LysE family translocator n=1 Tax=Clostridium massiliodielmoense TaxID=1776385 RepID=UPI0001663E25|nr:LysE family transporter [Clostridium massiliodielmoense]EDS76890.1 LysE type translocator [Clostridium botulinum C str. Eklund]KEH96675.1 lysine transporter LysE [Clostridium botulinum C/D str. BKT12695]NEZ48891.1 lysine transporter LysE [Clostridium botulinum]